MSWFRPSSCSDALQLLEPTTSTALDDSEASNLLQVLIDDESLKFRQPKYLQIASGMLEDAKWILDQCREIARDLWEIKRTCKQQSAK